MGKGSLLSKQYVDAFWAEVRMRLERDQHATSEMSRSATDMFRRRIRRGEFALYNSDPSEIAEMVGRQGLLIDPKMPLVPTLDEIATLPKWACRAFAARCARRVDGIFAFTWPDAPSSRAAWVQLAIAWAERRAAEKIVDLQLMMQESWVIAAAKQASDEAWKHGFRAAGMAANTAIFANEEPEQTCSIASQTVVFASSARTPVENYLRNFRVDLNILNRHIATENWDDETAVPPTVFGGIWPSNDTPDWARARNPLAVHASADFEKPKAPPEVTQ